MSLVDKKNALFGNAPMSSVPEEKKTSSSSSSQSKPKSAIGISPTLKTKKINEAKEHEDRGNKFLKTSV